MVVPGWDNAFGEEAVSSSASVAGGTRLTNCGVLGETQVDKCREGVGWAGLVTRQVMDLVGLIGGRLHCGCG